MCVDVWMSLSNQPQEDCGEGHVGPGGAAGYTGGQGHRRQRASIY